MGFKHLRPTVAMLQNGKLSISYYGNTCPEYTVSNYPEFVKRILRYHPFARQHNFKCYPFFFWPSIKKIFKTLVQQGFCKLCNLLRVNKAFLI